MKLRMRIFSLIICLFILVVATSCSPTRKGYINGWSADQLKGVHEVMLIACESNTSMMYDVSDFHSYSYFAVYYDGTITGYSYYNLTGRLGDFTAQLTPEDYNLIFDFLSDGFINGTYDVKVEAYDGSQWYYQSYDLSGAILHEFYGYTYDIEAYEEVQTILYSYLPAFEVPELYPEGVTPPED